MMVNLVEWYNNMKTKQWKNNHEASKAVEIIRLLGYEGQIQLNLDCLILQVNDVEKVRIPAGYCEMMLPSAFKFEIERIISEQRRGKTIDESNKRSFRMLGEMK